MCSVHMLNSLKHRWYKTILRDEQKLRRMSLKSAVVTMLDDQKTAHFRGQLPKALTYFEMRRSIRLQVLCSYGEEHNMNKRNPWMT